MPSLALTGLRGESELKRSNYGSTNYYLYYRQHKYSWEDAQRACQERSTFVATDPIPTPIAINFFDDVTFDTAVWIAERASGDCRTIKRKCRPDKIRQSALGRVRCDHGGFEWRAERTDCSMKLKFVVCQMGE